MLIDPGRGAVVGFDDFKNRVDLQILMREDRGAIFGRVARKKIRIDAAATVEQGQIEIDGFVIGHRRANDAGAQAGASGDGKRGGLRGWRKSAVVGYVVPEADGRRRATGD